MVMFNLKNCTGVNIKGHKVNGVVLSFDGESGEAVKLSGEVIKLNSLDEFNKACDKAAKGIL